MLRVYPHVLEYLISVHTVAARGVAYALREYFTKAPWDDSSEQVRETKREQERERERRVKELERYCVPLLRS